MKKVLFTGFCPAYHAPLNTAAPNGGAASPQYARMDMFGIEDGDYNAYVVKNTYKYLPRFKRFDAMAGNFQPTWHWPAFFVGPWWFLYRKMYLGALILFILLLVPYVNFFACLASGMSAYYFYYRQAHVSIERLREQYVDDALRSRLMELGGVHGWVPIVAVIANIGLFVAALIAALFGLLSLSSFMQDPNSLSYF